MKKTIITLSILLASFVCFSQKQDTATYVLIGKMADFQLLFKAIISPGDVTPNQTKALADWINKIMALPTEKKEEPKKEKPKQ